MTRAASYKFVPKMIAETHYPPDDRTDVIAMLHYARPANTPSERQFIRRYIVPLGVKHDPFGNYYKKIGTAPIIWSCHTDTVDCDYGTKYLKVETTGFIRLHAESRHHCLGADDTAGVWLMCEMIRANVPGLYVFHRQEESGGRGSIFFTKQMAKKLDLGNYQAAIALDRKGYDSVITKQAGGRCCSDEFARSLAAKLGSLFPETPFKPDSSGLFTDTANYTDLVGECTNLSVGYEGAHSKNESLDLDFLKLLRDRLCSMDLSNLVFKRKPGEVDPFEFDYEAGYAYTRHGGSNFPAITATGRTTIGRMSKPIIDIPSTPANTRGPVRTRQQKIDGLMRLCEKNPEAAAHILEAYGVDPDAFADLMFDLLGYSPINDDSFMM